MASPIAIPELLCLITPHLDYEDFQQCIYVSKEWNTAFTPFLWTSVQVYGAHKAHCVLPCAKALSRFGPSVRKVYTPRFLNSAGYFFYQQVIQHCHNLEEIHAYVPSIETWEMLLQIFQGPPKPTDVNGGPLQQTLDFKAAADQELSRQMDHLVLTHPVVPVALTTLDLEITEERGFSVCDILEHTPGLLHLSLNVNIGLSFMTLDKALALCPKLVTFSLQCESYEYPVEGYWPNPQQRPTLALKTLHLHGINSFDIFAHNLWRLPELEEIRIDLVEPRGIWPQGIRWSMCPKLRTIHFKTVTSTTSLSSRHQQRSHYIQDDMTVQDMLNVKVPSNYLHSLILGTAGPGGVSAIISNQLQRLVSLDIGQLANLEDAEVLSELIIGSNCLQRFSIGSIIIVHSDIHTNDQHTRRQWFDIASFVKPILDMGLLGRSLKWARHTLRTLRIPLSGPCILYRSKLEQETKYGSQDGIPGNIKLERDLLAALGMFEQLEELDLVCQECCTDGHTGQSVSKVPANLLSVKTIKYEECNGLEWSFRSGLTSLEKLCQLRSVRIILASSPPPASKRSTRRIEPDILEWMTSHWKRLKLFSYFVLCNNRLSPAELEERAEMDRKMGRSVEQWLAREHPGSWLRERSTASGTTIELHFLPLRRI
ncbi:hypothetical protein BGW41_001918 [Actinomortierella wolfii]|nr:hypothetical protein BGW41_001918 [Actinomortierella wolfii]